jgi:cyclopropane fatty-acyl-phospholipid synthase-like methyltransferase
MRRAPTELRVDARRIYSERTDSYLRFIRSVGYPQGIRSYFARASILRADLRILDAGCGSGVVSLALREALLARGLGVGSIDGFDLTPAMLERFREVLAARGISEIRLREANVLELDGLPEAWQAYDLVVSGSMLEHIPREALPRALGALRGRLGDGGSMVLFITRRNWLMKPLIESWWHANLYTRAELERAFERAGFSAVRFARFPLPYTHLNLWGHIVEARR